MVYWRSPSVSCALTTYRSDGLTLAGSKVSSNDCGNVVAGDTVLLASGAVPVCAVDDTLTKLITRFASGDNCAGSRKATVPLTTLATTSEAALPDAATPAPFCCDEGDALHPAKTNAASDVSNKTSLRMGKPRILRSTDTNLSDVVTPQSFAGETRSIAETAPL